ncbi:MAG TPA: helix-turn-helix domain-containing protein [Gaiellaceae bacterium]|nr:helix-turn-helix domain-containing protein [Gaiellaceae bacterium]
MPKISEEQRERRREQILAGARRCFAAHGYEGATVIRLEQETGLSRGAIFNYFPSKEEIFLALADRDADRLGRLWADEGLAAVVHALVEEDPDWLGTNLELVRRMRTDESFRTRWKQRAPEAEERIKTRLEDARAAGEVRDDVPLESVGMFVGLLMDGLALRRAAGFPSPEAGTILELVDSAIGGRARSRTPRRTPA